MTGTQDENMRHTYRVNDLLPMSIAFLSSKEFEEKKLGAGVRSRQNSQHGQTIDGELPATWSALDHPDYEIIKVLQVLDQKLNYLINCQMLREMEDLNLTEQRVNISVRSMSFITDKTDYQEGTYVEVVILLPNFPPLLMELLGTVRRVQATEDGESEVVIDFFFRSSDEEQHIASHVFARQREIIRMQALQEG